MRFYMKRKIFCILILLITINFNFFAYEYASMKNKNITYNDIVWNFYQLHMRHEHNSFHYAVTDWSVKTDPKKQNFYWSIYIEEKKDNVPRTDIVLWIDNGFYRISYYNKPTKFSDGRTWDLKNYNDYFEFRNNVVTSLSAFWSASELEKKKKGLLYTQEEKDQFYYLMSLFFGR